MYAQRGLFVPYPEKMQAGLTITDCRAAPLYQFTYPQQLYPSFAAIPPVVVSSLLFIEDRDLLDPKNPQLNPAVDWPRFAKATGRSGENTGGVVVQCVLPGDITDYFPGIGRGICAGVPGCDEGIDGDVAA